MESNVKMARIRNSAITKVLAFVLILPMVEAASWQNYSTLFNDMFSNYNLNLRPVQDDSTTLNVSLGFSILSLDAISEKEQTMSTSGWLEVTWVDDILKWDSASYNGIELMLLRQENIWKPDVTIKNTAKKRGKMGHDDQPVVIYNTGEVLWSPGDLYETSCDLVVTYYPFDTQICSISFELWVSTSSEINLQSTTTHVSTDFYSVNGQWELVTTSAEAVEGAAFPEVKFTLKFKRRELFYVVNVIIPIVFLSFLGPLVFTMPANSGEKMGVCITLLLAYTVFMTIIGDNIPQTSTQTCVLSVYLAILLAISACSVVLSAISLRLYHRPEEHSPSRRTKAVCRALRKFFCLRAQVRDTVTPFDEEGRKTKLAFDGVNHEERITWKMVSEVFDTFCFYFFSVMTVIATVTCLLAIVIGGPANA